MVSAFNWMECIANLFDAVAGIVFMFLMMGKKKQYKYKGTFWLWTAVYIFVLAMLQDKPESFAIQDLIIIAVLFLYALHLLSGSMVEKLIYSMLFTIILLFAAMTTHLLALQGFGVSSENAIMNGGMIRISTLIFDKLLLIGILSAIVVIRKHIELDYKEWMISFVIFLAILCISSSIGQIWSESEELAQYSSYLVMFMIGFVLMCVVAVICVYRLNVQHRYTLEYEVLKAKLDEEKYMLRRVEKMNENNKILRHDLKRYLTVVQGLLISGDMQGAKKYIEEAVDTHFDNDLTVYTNSSVINAVINDRKQFCENEHIAYDICVNGEIPEEMQLDMGIILSNLLENAYEAELREVKESRYIRLYMQQQKGMYFIRIENYIGQSVLNKNPELRSYKKDKGSHGLGIHSVKRLVAGAEGSYHCYENEMTFITEVMLPISSNYA